MDSIPDIELTKELIQLVKAQAFLYDKNLEDYKNESKKNEAWKKIAEALNLRVEETQNRWSRIRVDFGRHRRKKQSAEAFGLKNRDWPLYKFLVWLAPHVKMRATREKKKQEKPKPVKYEATGYKPILPRPSWLLNNDAAVKVEVSPSIMLPHEDITESLFVSPNTADHEDEGSLDNVHQSFLGKEMMSGKDHPFASNENLMTPSKLMGSEDEDEDNLFCRSVCASLKRLTHQQKALAKIRIQQVMYEVEFNH